VIARHRARFAGFLIASDVVAIVVSFLYTYLFRFYSYIVPVDPAKGVPPLRNYLVLIPFFVATHLAVFFLQGFYKSRLRRTQLDDFFSIGVNAAITIVVVTLVMAYGVTYGRGEAKILGQPVIELSRVFVVVYFVGVVFTISFLRNQIYYLMKRRYARGKDLQNVLIVGAGEMGVTVAQKLHQYRDLGFVVRGFLADDRPAGSMILIDGGVPVLGRIDDLEAVIESQGIREIYVALDLSNYPKIVATLQIVNRFPVNVRLIPDSEGERPGPGRIPGDLDRRGSASRRLARPQALDGHRRFRAGASSPLALHSHLRRPHQADLPGAGLLPPGAPRPRRPAL
jgi:FlaA1/EpsC-like NDP-sugar epimerase